MLYWVPRGRRRPPRAAERGPDEAFQGGRDTFCYKTMLLEQPGPVSNRIGGEHSNVAQGSPLGALGSPSEARLGLWGLINIIEKPLCFMCFL